MRNIANFVIKVYQRSRVQPFSAVERERDIPNFGSSLIVT